ncbi:Calcipressin [Flagelloscypha sp. PMI_526]|nr:Calcipressin [Flagelloscypha sp. PMI_526]
MSVHHSPSSSVASSSSSSPDSPTFKTNTIAVTGLPRTFFTRSILDVLREHFESYGCINQWAPLAGFGRIICVYESEDSVEKARSVLGVGKGVEIPGGENGSMIPLRIYRADPNPLLQSTLPSSFYLAPPPQDKNFLISPPGSPPVGWEPVVEHPPNPTPLAEDLMAALRKLQLQRQGVPTSGPEILLHPDEAGVGVYVEDCDVGDDMEDWAVPRKQPWVKPLATAMPPPISV